LRLAKAPVATSDLLAWKWRWPSGQPANFGNPIMTDDYALCVYDAADALVLRSDAPAGAICSGASCWAAKPGGSFVYRDPSGTPSGLVRLLLKTKPTGGAKLGLKGRGANLGVPSPAELDLPLRTQLHAGGSRCFEAAFAPVQVQRQDATQLKAKLP
jgi:hypothetical protein